MHSVPTYVSSTGPARDEYVVEALSVPVSELKRNTFVGADVVVVVVVVVVSRKPILITFSASRK